MLKFKKLYLKKIMNLKLVMGVLILCSIVIGVIVGFNKSPNPTKNDLIVVEAKEKLTISSQSAILIDYSTGVVMYEKNMNEKMSPASMTKMMAMYLVLESVAKGRLGWNDIITVSEYAASMGGSQVFLEPDEKMTVDDLFKATAIASANDAITALAEAVSGSIESFVSKMNEKAALIGMKNTNFVNVTGFYDKDHYTTAHDMGLLARLLLSDYKDDTLKYTSIYMDSLREGQFELVNTNKLIRTYDGMDGLKTGFIQESGYCLTSTASRDGARFITVIMNAATIDIRSKDTTTLLNYAFNNYKNVAVHKKDDVVMTYDFDKAKYENIELVAMSDVSITVSKDSNLEDITVNYIILNSSAPLKAGSLVMRVELTNNEGWGATYYLTVKEDVFAMTWWDLLLANLRSLFA